MQVLKRAFQLLKLLQSCEKMRLREIADIMDLESNTVWNLLAAMVEMGYVKKEGRGCYAIGDECINFFCESFADNKNILAPYMEKLCKNLKESVVAVTLSGSVLKVLASMDYLEDFCVSNRIYCTPDALYKWASGRLVLAWQPDNVIKHIFSKYGLPEGNEWKGVYTENAALKRLKEIRKKSSTERLTKYKNGKILYSLAVPVFDCKGKFRLALGVTYSSVSESKIHRETVYSHLAFTAQEISEII